MGSIINKESIVCADIKLLKMILIRPLSECTKEELRYDRKWKYQTIRNRKFV